MIRFLGTTTFFRPRPMVAKNVVGSNWRFFADAAVTLIDRNFNSERNMGEVDFAASEHRATTNDHEGNLNSPLISLRDTRVLVKVLGGYNDCLSGILHRLVGFDFLIDSNAMALAHENYAEGAVCQHARKLTFAIADR